MIKFLSWRSQRERNWKAVVDVKFRDPMLQYPQIMLKALKILLSDRVKWADIYPPHSPSHRAAFPSVCSVHIGANLTCLSRLQQLH